MALEQRDGTYWSVGEQIDNDGIRFVNGDSRLYRLAAKNMYDGVTTLEVHDGTNESGTPIVTLKMSAQYHCVDARWPNGLYLDTGCVIVTDGTSGETAVLQALDLKREGNAGKVS